MKFGLIAAALALFGTTQVEAARLRTQEHEQLLDLMSSLTNPTNFGNYLASLTGF
jgi:hypothetical protein